LTFRCTVLYSGESNFKFGYVGKSKTEFENVLGYESGAQVGSIDEKTRGRKSCATVPLFPKADRLVASCHDSSLGSILAMSVIFNVKNYRKNI
jgi:hypothetical protein